MQGTLATRADFWTHGLPAEAFAPARRPVIAVDAAADVLRLGAIAPAAGSPVRIESTGSLPAPLSASAVYYVLEVIDAEDLLQLAATAGGAAINMTDAGDADAVHELVVQVGPILDAVLLATSQLWVEDMLAHGGEIAYADCPEHIRKGIVEEAAGNVSTTRGLLRPGYADPTVQGRAAEARRQRRRYGDGKPVRGLVDATPDVADNGARFEVLGSTTEATV